MEITPDIRNKIGIAMKRMAESDENNRSLTEFLTTVQRREIRIALQDFTSQGQNGELLDASSNSMKDARFLTFEMEKLMGSDEESGRTLSRS